MDSREGGMQIEIQYAEFGYLFAEMSQNQHE
jgi:hypothetical protein